MNGFERINAALKGERPDKTPVMLHNFMMAAHEAGFTMHQFRESPKIMADSFIRSVEQYHFDGILVDMDTVTLAGAAGVQVDFPIHEPARSRVGYLESLTRISALEMVNVENYKYVQVWLEAVRLIKDHFKNEIFIRGNCDQAPFSLASMLRGTQDWMLDLMMGETEMIFALLTYCAKIGQQFIRLMAQTGCDMLSNGDSTAGPEMVSPEMYRTYALPYERLLVEESHKSGLPYALHICGNTGTILPFMLGSGADAFELDYKTDAKIACELMQNKACFIGNIDPSGVLALGSKDMVALKTRELLTLFTGNNRFILNAGCAIPPFTPSENLMMLIDTARNF